MTISNFPDPESANAAEPANPHVPRHMGRLIGRYQENEVLFREGDLGREMFIVLSGAVQISKLVAGEQLPLGIFRSGDFFGEMALVEAGVRTATATVQQDDTELVAVNQARFVYLVSQQPAFALSVMRMMGRRVEEMNQRLVQMGAVAQAESVQ